MSNRREEALWRRPGFARLWAGQTVSLFGSRITFLALPLTAILTLQATPFQVGFLEALPAAASILFGLFAGVWADRLPRRRIMIAANLGQAAVLATIPLAARFGVLQLPQVYTVAFLAASMAVFFAAAYRSYLPSVVPADRLIEANSRLAMSQSSAQVAGPALGGWLVQLLTAPAAILIDALSFVLSAATLARAAPESPREREDRGRIQVEIRQGLRAVLIHPILRSLAGATALFNFFDSVLLAVYVLYMVRTLHLSPATVGLVFGLAGIGGLIGSAVTGILSRRFGLGRALVAGIALSTGGELLIAGASGPPLAAVLVLLAAEALVELGASLFSINAISLQQAIVPDALRGRVSATNSLLGSSMAPVGAVLGGVLGQSLGLRETILIAGAGTLLALVWIAVSPVLSLQRMPAPS